MVIIKIDGFTNDIAGHGTGDTGLHPAFGGTGLLSVHPPSSLCFAHKQAVGIIKQFIGPARRASPTTPTEATGCYQG